MAKKRDRKRSYKDQMRDLLELTYETSYTDDIIFEAINAIHHKDGPRLTRCFEQIHDVIAEARRVRDAMQKIIAEGF